MLRPRRQAGADPRRTKVEVELSPVDFNMHYVIVLAVSFLWQRRDGLELPPRPSSILVSRALLGEHGGDHLCAMSLSEPREEQQDEQVHQHPQGVRLKPHRPCACPGVVCVLLAWLSVFLSDRG